MSRLRELIDELCPDGVEYKALGDLATKIVDGSHKVPPKSNAIGALPMMSAQNVIGGRLDATFGRLVSPDAYAIEAQRTKAHRNDVLLTIVGAIGRTAVLETDDILAFQRSVCVITVDEKQLEPRFLRYALDTSTLQSYMASNARGAAQKGFYLAQVAELSIPVPPIEVQREIVHILDSFQELDDALTAEIEARETQFGEYCEVVFPNDSDTGVSLNDICVLIADCPHSTAPDEGVGYPLIRTPNIGRGMVLLDDVHRVSEAVYRKRIARAIPRKDDLILAREGTAGNVAIIPDGTDVCLGQRTVLLRPNPEIVNPSYLSFYLNANSQRERLLSKSAGSTVPHINLSDIRSFPVSIPSLDAQQSVLNRIECQFLLLDALRSERDARRKQFEHYRDKLLSFPEKEA